MIQPEDETLSEFEKAADLRFRNDVADLYEQPIREAKKLWRQYSNAGIAAARKYSEQTADEIIDAFKALLGIVERDYVKPLAALPRGITTSREEWLRSKVDKVTNLQTERAQGNVDRLCLGFGSTHHSLAVSRLQGEASVLKRRIEDLVALAVLDSKSVVGNTPRAISGVPITQQVDASPLIFISHSSKDEKLAEALIDFLRAGLGLSDKQIRCSSVNGYRLPAGAHTDSKLREEVNAAAVVIGLITVNSLRSCYVTFELGARWGAGSYLIPLLAGIKPTDLPSPFEGFNSLSGNDESQLHQLLEELAKRLALSVSSPASYHRHQMNLKELAGAVSGGDAS